MDNFVPNKICINFIPDFFCNLHVIVISFYFADFD